MKKRLKNSIETYANIKTGEIREVISFMPEAHDSNFVKVFKVFTERVIKDLKAGIDGAIYTLIWFIDQIQDMKPNQEPIVIANPEDIAKDLGVSRRTINRHLKLLIELDYIEQIMSRQFMYRVNPEMIFKGVLKQYFNEKASKKKKQGEEKTTRTAIFTIDGYVKKENKDER